jgi:hypothetical protein
MVSLFLAQEIPSRTIPLKIAPMPEYSETALEIKARL